MASGDYHMLIAHAAQDGFNGPAWGHQAPGHLSSVKSLRSSPFTMIHDSSGAGAGGVPGRQETPPREELRRSYLCTVGCLGCARPSGLPWPAPAGWCLPHTRCPACPPRVSEVGVHVTRRAPTRPHCHLTSRICRGRCSGLQASAERAVSGGVCVRVPGVFSVCFLAHRSGTAHSRLQPGLLYVSS